jgi:hypothetical protein
MDATTYTGTGTTNVIVTQSQFKPDLTWFKGRGNAENHALFDTVRGVNKNLAPNTTIVEGTQTDMLMAFNSNGFTLGADGNQQVNKAATTFVSWNWQAGQGSTSSNTSGSITSTVSANTTAGFSIVTYTGTGSNATVGHGLGVAPSWVIVKSRTTAENWMVYHISTGATKYIYLDSSGAAVTLSTIWNNTAPTSSVFSVGTNVTVNQSSTNYVAYCFAAISGYSAFGSYTGNSSADGPFVYLGFRPKYIIIRKTDTGNYWVIQDSSRSSFNVVDKYLAADDILAETTSSQVNVDFLSNGFKLRSAFDIVNAGSYIYMAFAENPFKNANAR